MSISERIKSVRESIGKEYIRPDPGKVDDFILDLQSCQEAKDYLMVSRGYTEDTIKHFKLGYDKDKEAITIPMYKNGELINIKYRYLRPERNKYTSERNAETWLFNDEGLTTGKSKDGVLVVEGEFDLISIWQSGIHNVISVGAGKDSYGVWIELLDRVGRVYLAFDNDDGGRTSSRKFAERVGLEKTFEVIYPKGIKDANEFFLKHTKDDFINILKTARPYYTQDFKGVADVIKAVREGDEDVIESKWIPHVKLEKDWLVVLSGDTNVGKTTFSLNVVKDFAERGIPTLVLPFERGTLSVGKRFLQVLFDKSAEDLAFTPIKEWEEMIDKAVDMPVYFSTPKKNDTVQTIRKAKRFFDTKVVIVDHLDYIIRQVNGNRENEIANTLQDYKRLAEELGIVFVVVSHLRKRERGGRPTLDDLKGSSSLNQDPECVILLSHEEGGGIYVDIAKNKGPMGHKVFGINLATGALNLDPNDF